MPSRVGSVLCNGLGQLGDADSATLTRRWAISAMPHFGYRRFGDGTSRGTPIRRRDISAITDSATVHVGDGTIGLRDDLATGRFGDGAFRRREVSARAYDIVRSK